MANPKDTVSSSRKHASYAKAVGSFVPGLTRKSFEKYGFSTATLLTDWTIIAGRDLASFTLPERLKWPRNVEAFEETSDDARGRPGATLVLRVDGPRAIEVQYQTGQIIERINAHFGYKAVSDIRFIQAPLSNRPALAEPRAGEIAEQKRRIAAAQTAARQSVRTRADACESDALLAALDRLHANITRARSL